MKHTMEPWIIQKLNHAENEPWYQIGWLEKGRSIGPICELSGGAVRSRLPVWHPVAEFKYLIANEMEIEANARRIVDCGNALAGLNPGGIAALVEVAERFVKYYQGSRKSHLGNGQAYTSHTELEQALKAVKGE